MRHQTEKTYCSPPSLHIFTRARKSRPAALETLIKLNVQRLVNQALGQSNYDFIPSCEFAKHVHEFCYCFSDQFCEMSCGEMFFCLGEFAEENDC